MIERRNKVIEGNAERGNMCLDAQVGEGEERREPAVKRSITCTPTNPVSHLTALQKAASHGLFMDPTSVRHLHTPYLAALPHALCRIRHVADSRVAWLLHRPTLTAHLRTTTWPST